MSRFKSREVKKYQKYPFTVQNKIIIILWLTAPKGATPVN
jgi:hypothetical protein